MLLFIHLVQEIRDYFDNTWTLTEVMFSSLRGEEAFRVAPYHSLRHPMIFYYGHPAALYVNKLRVAGLLSEPINPYYEAIFETGVDEMSWDDLSKNSMPWPSVEEVKEYRKKVYSTVVDLISKLPQRSRFTIDQSSPLWALALSFEHERIHLETSSVLISELPLKYVSRPRFLPPYHATAAAPQVKVPESGKDYPVNSFISVNSSEVALGKPKHIHSFGWDNEYGEKSVRVPPFEASKYKVSNGEYLEFVRAGGYGRRELWSDAGWAWRSFRNSKWPTFWVPEGPQGLHEFRLRVLFDEVSMPWDWPVVVNYHEAMAYANWRTNEARKQNVDVEYRLMTELEHHVARSEEAENASLKAPRSDYDPVLHASDGRLYFSVSTC